MFNGMCTFNRVLGMAMLLMLSGQTFAEEKDSDEWQYAAEFYIWGSQIVSETSSGIEAEIPFYKVLDNLQMTFMGAFGARKDKWTFAADLIYVDLKTDANRDASYPGGDVTVTGTVELKSWMVTPTVRYAIVDTEKTRFEVLTGVRYLYLNTAFDVFFDQNQVAEIEDSGSNWDILMGLNAQFNLNEKWYIPMYVDVGTGDSKSTWQGMAGIGYRWNKLDIMLTYRYLNYKFKDDSPALGSLTMNGPLLGFTYKF